GPRTTTDYHYYRGNTTIPCNPTQRFAKPCKRPPVALKSGGIRIFRRFGSGWMFRFPSWTSPVRIRSPALTETQSRTRVKRPFRRSEARPLKPTKALPVTFLARGGRTAVARRRIPSYRHYKPKNLGLVVLNGKAQYLGKYGTPESLAEYNRLIQEWLVCQQTHSGGKGKPPQLTVNALILAVWRVAEQNFRHARGTPPGE